MNIKRNPIQGQNRLIKGVTLVELMVGLTIGIMLSISILGVYMAQFNTYKTNVSQSTIQNAENAVSAILGPAIRSAGFSGCTTITKAISNLNAGGPAPLGILGTTQTMVMGYDSTAGVAINIAQDNAPNDGNTAHWSPALDASLAGFVESVSDVLIILSPVPGSTPVAVTSIPAGSNSLTLQNTNGISAGQFGSVSDCAKSSVFLITGVAGTTITHSAGGGPLANATDALSVNYQIGAQFIPLVQSAFFVSHDPSGQSALVRATLNSNNTWTLQSLIPNVETMQVLYGVGSSGALQNYVTAGAVANWSQVYAIRIGFLIEGQQGSGTKVPTQYKLLGTTINVPNDNRLRHVFEMTINLRNTNS